MSELETRHKNILNAANSVLLVIDVQERFRPHIEGFSGLTAAIVTLVKGCDALAVPVIVSEQYTKGLGPTVNEIKKLESAAPWHYFEKNCFSTVGADGFLSCLKKLGRSQIIVCGIETHVCVNQTVHGLLELGYQPHIVVDAVASRSEINKKIGLEKMIGSGAQPTTVEMALFEMLVEAGTAKFKEVQSLVK
ncbi:MAG: hydrolase [Cyanobacteria bacterium SZAS LIN-3]|nr:hydrolase [Cyanobacteria bacterium SZAS LIN-3]MBS2010466.1 hydrolase [Cyanobacteria bacterium SZAS TMP-1]